MPTSVTVAAFVFGTIFLMAAIIGKDIKIISVEIPAMTGSTRYIVGLFGFILLLVGFFDIPPQRDPNPNSTPIVGVSTQQAQTQVLTQQVPTSDAASPSVINTMVPVVRPTIVLNPTVLNTSVPLSTSTVTPTASSNLVRNGNFDEDLTDWKLAKGKTANITNGDQDGKAVAVSYENGDSEVYQAIQGERGRSYQIAVRCKAEQGSYCSTVLSDDGDAANYKFASIDGDGTWQEITSCLLLKAGPLIVYLDGTPDDREPSVKSSKSVLYDDVILTQVDGC